MLTINHLTKTYGTTTVVDHVDFHLKEKRCVALIGPNGAGKTTIMRMLTNSIAPTKGTIQLFGERRKDIRPFIGYLAQHPVFYPWMTGFQYILHAASLCQLPKNTAIERAKDLLERVGIYEARNKRIGTYSGGMKQRLGIAQAIIHKPKLLLLDEPVSALDPIGRRDILTLMQQLKEEMTILFSTHILHDAEEVSDELLLLHEGRIVESGEMSYLRKKYETAMIEVQFTENNELYVEELQTLATVIDSSISRNYIHLSVTDITLARKEILQRATENQWPLNHFSINEVSLEEMFMKVVKTCNG